MKYLAIAFLALSTLAVAQSPVQHEQLYHPSYQECRLALGAAGEDLCLTVENDKHIILDLTNLANDLKKSKDLDLMKGSEKFLSLAEELEKADDLVYEAVTKILKEREKQS